MAAAIADRGIDVVALEIDQAGRSGDADIDAGMGLLERGKPRQQPLGGQRGQRGNRQHAVVLLAQEPVGGKPQIVERGANAGKVFLRLWRKREAAVLPDEQANPEFFLKPPDLMADGGLGDVQLSRRIGKAQMAGGGLEGAQPIERWQAGGHLWGCLSMILYHLKRREVSFVEIQNSADIVVKY